VFSSYRKLFVSLMKVYGQTARAFSLFSLFKWSVKLPRILRQE
jgi:hypothetical protein